MNTLCLTSKISRNHDVAYTQIDTDLVMLELEMNMFCNVNPTGAVLWTLLENNTLSLDELCKHVHKHYEVTDNECRNDVTQFVEEMAALKLLIITNDVSVSCNRV